MTESKKESLQRKKTLEFQAKVKRDASDTLDVLVNKFFNFFITHDYPDGDEVKAKEIQLNAQWVTYCKVHKLKPFTFSMFQDSVKELRLRYAQEKKPQPQTSPVKKTWREKLKAFRIKNLFSK